MKQIICLTLAVTLSVCTTAYAEEATKVERGPHSAVWVTPISPAPVAAGTFWPPIWYVTIGADLPVADQTIQLEIGIHTADFDEGAGDVRLGGYGGSVAGSWKWTLNPQAPMRGFFAAFKFYVGFATSGYGYTRDWRLQPRLMEQSNQSVLDVQVGADVGYQWTFFDDHFYLALLIGGTVGGTEAAHLVEGTVVENHHTGPFRRPIGTVRKWTPSAQVNMNFFRLGFAW